MSHARSPSLLAVAALAAAALVAPRASGNVNLLSNVWRFADESGLTDSYWTANINFNGAAPFISATRPNGQSVWDQSFGSQLTQYLPWTGSWATGAQVDAWMDSNTNGTFGYSYVDFQGTTVNNTINFGPFYTPPSQRTYFELTPDSIALFRTIFANGLTGTFTFRTTQTLADCGFSSASLRFMMPGAAPISANPVTSGNEFTIDISSVLMAGTTLQISGTTELTVGGVLATTNSTFPQICNAKNSSATVYSAVVVPAPGALALLGVAGLARRRRRD